MRRSLFWAWVVIGVVGTVAWEGRTSVAADYEVDGLLNRSLHQLKAYVMDMKSRNESLEKRIQSLRSRLEELQQEEELQKQEAHRLQEEIQKLTLIKETAEHEGFTMVAELEWLKQNLRWQRHRLRTLMHAMLEKNSRLRKLTKLIGDTEGGFFNPSHESSLPSQKGDGEIKDVQTKENFFKASHRSFNHREGFAGSRQDTKKLNQIIKRVERLRRLKDHWIEQFNNLKSRYLKLAAANDALQEDLKEMAAHPPLRTFQKRWEKLIREEKQLKQDAARLKEELPKLNEEWQQQEDLRQAVMIENEQLEEYREILLQENEALKKQLAKRRSLTKSKNPSQE